ncbi:UNVERIFIED_CONTAM: hypothetical protein Sradi_3187500 [Sesamum radiatum]|uniref:Uncharacterized protein n=1 Tax=Sesamum radiatum TaxID=300843 RepID=A0AAW2RFW2_SESRA
MEMAAFLGVRIDSIPAKDLGLPTSLDAIRENCSAISELEFGNESVGGKRKCSHKQVDLAFERCEHSILQCLRKQGWRFMVKPNLLINRILKARYFLDNEFLHEKIGYNPSFTWRSILAARYIISKELDGGLEMVKVSAFGIC